MAVDYEEGRRLLAAWEEATVKEAASKDWQDWVLRENARTRMGLSLQELADACHVSKTHIWEIEQERTANPSARLVWDLSQALAIDPAFLLKAAALLKAEG